MVFLMDEFCSRGASVRPSVHNMNRSRDFISLIVTAEAVKTEFSPLDQRLPELLVGTVSMTDTSSDEFMVVLNAYNIVSFE